MTENPVATAPEPTTNWPLRMAQQAFANVLDRCPHTGRFGTAQRRQGARQALAALSAKERGPFECWLALQLMTSTTDGTRAALATLGIIDKVLAAAVGAQLARAEAEFLQPITRMEVEGVIEAAVVEHDVFMQVAL